MKKPRKHRSEIRDYDAQDVTSFINPAKNLKFEDLGLKIPACPPTQVVSIRLPSELLNELKALGSQRDIPYQALIKLYLAESITRDKKKSA